MLAKHRREKTLHGRQCQQQEEHQRHHRRLNQEILIILEAMLYGHGMQGSMAHADMVSRAMHLRHINIHRMHVQAMALIFCIQFQMPMNERRKDLQQGKPEHDDNRHGRRNMRQIYQIQGALANEVCVTRPFILLKNNDIPNSIQDGSRYCL